MERQTKDIHKRQSRIEISRRTHKSGGDDRPHTQGEWTQKGIGDDNKDNVKADAKEMA